MTDSQEPPPQTPDPDPKNSFWAELKRRRVVRVAITYAVVAWLIIQVASSTFGWFDIPKWAFQFVVIMLVTFFPVAIVLAWAFELTPEGIKTTKSARASRDGAPASAEEQRRRSLRAIVFAAALPTLIFGALAVFFFFRADRGIALDDKSIAVLPFTAFSTEEEERFFADGLSDTLLHKLAQLSDIRVISRSSSFQYRGDSVDVRKVGAELNVSTVLEGSVQRSGDRLRIIAQLINTEDGGHIWSKTFDRSSADTFAIHDEIAEAVVNSLRVQTTEEEEERLDYDGTSSVEAYTLLTLLRERSNMTAGFNLEREVFEERQLQTIEELEKVLEIDPNYAEVFRVKAEIYSSILFRGAGGSSDYYIRKGFEAVRQAMLLEPKNPYNFLHYAEIARRNGDPVTAETFARVAYSQLPNDREAVVTLNLSLYSQGKNAEECLALVEKEKSLGESGFTWRRHRFALMMLGRHEQALETVLEVLRGPELSQIAASDYSYSQSDELGRHVEAIKELIAFRERLGDSVSNTFWQAWLHIASNVGLDSEIRKILEQSGRAGDSVLEVRMLWGQGKHQEAIEWLNAKGWEWNTARARNSMMLGDFETAVELLTLERENLESRQGKRPYLVESGDFSIALSLIDCYRNTGERGAAARLLSEAREYIDSRTVNGYAPTRGYQLCILHLLSGERSQALEVMKKRIYLEGDAFVPLQDSESFSLPVFEALKNDETFQKLVAEYERRRAASAEKIEAMIEAAGY